MDRDEREIQLIYEVMAEAGITSNYRGYRYVAEALKLYLENREDRVKITKDIYPVLARRYEVPSGRVEQNIRFMVELLWEKNRGRLEQIAGIPLSCRPSNQMFLMMLTCYLRKQNETDRLRQSPTRVRA